PGITSISALTARHRVPLTRVGRPVHVTTGRRLAAEGVTADDVLVMLDAACSFAEAGDDLHIYWGAYLGTPDEILISGPVREVADEIRTARAEARARKGWIMDTYLLRRPCPDAGAPPVSAGAARSAAVPPRLLMDLRLPRHEPRLGALGPHPRVHLPGGRHTAPLPRARTVPAGPATPGTLQQPHVALLSRSGGHVPRPRRPMRSVPLGKACRRAFPGPYLGIPATPSGAREGRATAALTAADLA